MEDNGEEGSTVIQKTQIGYNSPKADNKLRFSTVTSTKQWVETNQADFILSRPKEIISLMADGERMGGS